MTQICTAVPALLQMPKRLYSRFSTQVCRETNEGGSQRDPYAGRIPLVTRFARGIAGSLVSGVATQGGTFLVNIVVANILGRAVFGEYATIMSTMVSGAVLAQLASGYTATKYLSEFRTTDKQRAGRVLALCSTVSALSALVTVFGFTVCAQWLATEALRAPHLTWALRIGAGFLGLSVLNGYQIGVLQGLEAYGLLSRASVLGGIMMVIFCAAFTWLAGVNGAVFGLLLSAAIRWAAFRYCIAAELLRQEIRPDYRNMKREKRTLSVFALPAALAGVTMAPAPWLANLFLVRQPGGFEQMALYAAAFNMMTIVMFLPRVISPVAMSLINSQKGTRNDAGYRAVFLMNLVVTFASVLVGVAFVATAAPFLLRLFGKSFASDGHTTLLVLLLAPFAEALWMTLSQVFQSNERMWTLTLVVNLPRDICLPVMAYLLVGHGAPGLATAYTASQFAALCAILIVVSRTGLQAVHSGDNRVAPPEVGAI